MKERIGLLYFSPTNTTKKICSSIAAGLGENNPQLINMAMPSIRSELIKDPTPFTADLDHLIVGAPVYTGKLPLQVIDCLNSLKGEGKTCTAVVVYGNRDYGVALKQMVELLSDHNFSVVSAGAFIGQHSYSDLIPVAMGRPDDQDLNIAFKFGKDSTSRKLSISLENVPVQLDLFSKSKNYTPLVPHFIETNCTSCSLCSEYCPTGIISSDTGDFLSKEAKKQCIGCMACVQVCANSARILKPDFVNKFIVKYVLRNASKSRVEPLTIFA
mgnify:CR=1 FL=1